MERKRAARYNPKNRKNFSLDDWKLVASAVRRHADTLDIAQLSQWASKQTDLAEPRKCHQDRLDAAICLIIALQWRRVPRHRLAVIGDGRTGYMVTAGFARHQGVARSGGKAKECADRRALALRCRPTISRHPSYKDAKE